MTYEEFRKQSYAKCPKDIELSEFAEISEYFCECDYKRHTGEWLTEDI